MEEVFSYSSMANSPLFFPPIKLMLLEAQAVVVYLQSDQFNFLFVKLFYKKSSKTG
jgi:hypothetical protein